MPSDGEIFKIATDAYNEMKRLFEAENIRTKDRSSVMAALAVDNQVFLASSIKDRASMYTYDGCSEGQDRGKLHS